jgi:hypothetical protein
VTDIGSFELYLLSKMRAPELVDPALVQRGVSREQMRKRAAALGSAYELDASEHSADAYPLLLGPPHKERALSGSDTPDVFAGSLRWTWTLPSWPRVLFAVHRHPRGYSWGVGFEQQGPLPATAEIRPWTAAADAMLSVASHVERLEEWSDQLDAILTFASGDAWRARFDLGLLQRWGRAPDANPSDESGRPTLLRT